MTFYQELQLNSAGSKKLIKNSLTKKEKWRHIIIFNIKIYLVVAFCFLFVTLYSMLFGSSNSIVGVVVLLGVLVLRQVDFGIKVSHTIFNIWIIYGIYAICPIFANSLTPGKAFIVDFVSIMAILLLSCYNVVMSNQSTFVLGYLLLEGYNVSGADYTNRLYALLLGAVICSLVFYKTHRRITYHKTFSNLFSEFNIHDEKYAWYLRLTIGISSAAFFMSLFNIPRAMWMGIAVMSVLSFNIEDVRHKFSRRIIYNIVGCAIFTALYYILPSGIYAFVGIIGGIGVGYSASYAWQTVFNTFGALAVAEKMFGLTNALMLRIFVNLAGALYVYAVDKTGRHLSQKMAEKFHHNKKETSAQ